MTDTLPGLLMARAAGAAVAFRAKRLGIYRERRWDELALQVSRVGQSLSDWGVRAGQPIALLSDVREEALVADLAAQALGCPVLVISRDEDGPTIARRIAAARATTAIVEDQEGLDKLAIEAGAMPDLLRIVAIEEVRGGAASGQELVQFARLAAGSADLGWLADRAAQCAPEMPSTALPRLDLKPRFLTQAEQLGAGRALLARFPALNVEGHRAVALLPAHRPLGRLGALILPLLTGLQPHFADLPTDLPMTLAETRPGLVLTSAAWLDHMAAMIQRGIAATSPAKRVVYRMAAGGALAGLGRTLAFHPILHRIGISTSTLVLYQGILSDAAVTQWRTLGIEPIAYDGGGMNL